MRSLIFVVALLFSAPVAVCAAASDEDLRADIHAAYRSFAEAQNARDLPRVRSFLVDGPDFLWVSDGRTFWGADTTIERMGQFQKAEVWRVEPELDVSRVVQVGPLTALLQMPLTLVIGRTPSPDRLRFLVSILFVRQSEHPWKIAALLTTLENKDR